jgi:hypothetical protein
MTNLVPVEVRKYIQRIALSVPIGVEVHVMGDTALDIYTGHSPKHISLWITGFDILSEGKHYIIKEVSETSLDVQLTFFGHVFNAYDEFDCMSLRPSAGEYHHTQFGDITLGVYLIKEQMGLLSILKCLPMNILKCYIKDVASIDWEASLVNKALDIKEVEVYSNDNDLFLYKPVITKTLVEEYKEKFPGFRFYMEM